MKSFKECLNNLESALTRSTRQVEQNNAKLGAVNKVLGQWQRDDKKYHDRKEESDRAIENKLDKIIELLKKK